VTPRRIHGPGGLWLALAILLVSLNLRGAVVAIAPMLEEAREATGMSATAAGLLAAIPLVSFGVFAFPAARLARRLGMERTIVVAMVLLTAGIMLRLATPVSALFIGTAILGIAIAVCNVLLPAIIKGSFPGRTGSMTGLYVVAMSVGGVIAAGATVPLQDATGLSWRATLALWAVPSAIAAVLWVPYVRLRRTGSADAGAPHGVEGVWRSPLAWQVAGFMGMQGLLYYTCTAWVPTVLIDSGMSTEAAGAQLALLNLVGIPVSLVVPTLAARARTQRRYVAVPTALCACGLVGLILAPTAAAPLWMTLLGLGQGATIGLAIAFFVLRAPDSAHAAELSGMAQTIGYLLAATGPLAFGLLHDLAGGWTIPLAVMTALLLAQLATGLGAARDLHVGRTHIEPTTDTGGTECRTSRSRPSSTGSLTTESPSGSSPR
jgi:CP family cyanate transporter-like MFS transporter